MKKSTTVAAAALLTLGAAASAYAQGGPPRSNKPLEELTAHEAMRIKDPVQREEAQIAGASRRLRNLESRAGTRRFVYQPTFKAQVNVTNQSPKTIKYVSWSASLTDPGTGAVIRTYDVMTKSRIAPGKTKRLTEKLAAPRTQVISAPGTSGRRSPTAADLKATVTRVTYEDGTTSATP